MRSHHSSNIGERIVRGAIAGAVGSLAMNLFARVARHRGHQTAIVALARTLVITAYSVLARETTYHELGAAYFDQRHPSGPC